MALTNTQLATELYVAYFNRAPDPVGLNVWVNALNNGQTLDTAANLFANSTEAQSLYPFLALHTAPDPGTAAGFVNAVYENLLNRAPDADGATYWTGLLTTGKITVGQFIVDVVQSVNMQSGTADAMTLQNKVAVADFYTNLAASLNTTPSLAAETAAIAGVTGDAASVTAAEARITTNTAHNTYTLTAGADVISDISGVGHDIVNAPLVVGASGQSQSLSVGDSIVLTGDNNIANITLGGTIGAVWPAGSTISGAQTVNFQNVGDVLPIPGLIPAIIPGNDITGMTTANMVNSAASVLIGGNLLGLGNTGLPTLLTTVGMTNDGVQTFALEVQAATLAAATDPALTVNLSGVGANTGAMNGAPTNFVGKVFFPNSALTSTSTQEGALWVGPDVLGGPGYTSMTFNVTGNNAIQLGTMLSDSLTAVTIAGAGGLLLDGSTAASGSIEGSNVTTITSTASGDVIITGGSQNTGNAASPLGIVSAIAGPAGFLGANHALTSVTTGAGNDWVDISSMSLAAVTGNKLAVDLGTGTNELVVDASVATSAAALTFFADVQVLGVAGGENNAGDDATTATTTGLAGKINVANLPTSVNEIQFVNADMVTDDIVISNIGNNFTVDVGNAYNDHSDHNLTLISTTPGSSFATTLDIGLATTTNFPVVPLPGPGTHSFLGEVTISGFQTANLNSFGDGLFHNTIEGLVVSNLPGSSVTLNIGGTDALHIEQATAPLANDLALQLLGNGSFIVDTDKGAVTIEGNTLAGSINAASSGGWIMQGADLANVGTIGVNLTGSTAHYNQLAGSLGNDLIATGSGVNADGVGDFVWTMGGADTVTLTAGHSAPIHIGLFDTFSGVDDGLITSSSTLTITNESAGDLLGQQGFWGVAPGGAPLDLTLATGPLGVSTDQSTVSNFHVGKNGDVIVIETDAWVHSGTNLGLANADLSQPPMGLPGTPVTIEQVATGGTFGGPGDAGANLTEIVGTTFANAKALATALTTGAFNVVVHAANPGASTGDSVDVLVAYSDGKNTHIADVNVVVGANAGWNADTLLHDIADPGAGLKGGIHVSDMVQLTGVADVTTLTAANVHLI